MKKIAVFGAKGYLGRQLTFFLRQQDAICDEFDMPESDVAKDAFWNTFDPGQYNSILFFAGLTGTEKGFSEAARYVTVNEIGLLNLLNKLAPLGQSAPKVIFPSSRLVYKGAEHPLCEDDAKEAKTVYAANKLVGEHYLAAYKNRFGIPYCVVRICVPYGNLISTDYSYGTVGFFVKQACEGRISLFGDGSQRRTFTHVVDICKVVHRLTDLPVEGVFNIGGNNLSLFEAATIIASRKGATVVSVPWPETASRLESGSTVFDSTRLASAIHIETYQDFRTEKFP